MKYVSDISKGCRMVHIIKLFEGIFRKIGYLERLLGLGESLVEI